MNYLPYNATPVQEVYHPSLDNAGVRLLIKREDLNHPTVSGNKWWKLKYNLIEARAKNLNTILTFGGAYSNHIFATAAAAFELGLQSIGIIRGEEVLPLNPTLSAASDHGMILRHVSREAYRSKNDPSFIGSLNDEFGDFYLIPEGGTNRLAVKGCAEFYSEIANLAIDTIMLAVGTGGTIAGLVAAGSARQEIIGVPVLKNGEFLQAEINSLVADFDDRTPGDFKLLTDYHFGGYARANTTLIRFIRDMRAKHNLPLDPVYTGKLLFAVLDEARLGHFRRGSTILAIHSGGLQGAATIMSNFE